jgi:hypothetical protein
MVCTLIQTNAAMLGSCGFLVHTYAIATWLFFGSSLLLLTSGLVVLVGPRPSRASGLETDDSLSLEGPEPKGRGSDVELTNVARGAEGGGDRCN